MKTILLASALMIGGVAHAQTEPQSSPPPPAAAEPMPANDANTTSGSGAIVEQQGGNLTAPPADTGPYPRCSRTVTDHCRQSAARESDTRGGPPAHRRPSRHR